MYGVVGVLATARRAASIEILFDVVPAKTAYLQVFGRCGDRKTHEWATHLVTTRTRLEVDVRNVHLFQTEGALCIFLQ